MNKITHTDTECTNPEVGRLIGHYEMDLLPDQDRERFEEHLLDCDFCRGEVEAMFTTSSAMLTHREAILKGLKEDGITLESAQTELERPADGSGGRRREVRRSRSRVYYWGLTAVAAAAAVLLLVRSIHQEPSSPYESIISFTPLTAPTPITLRGKAMSKGQEYYDQGMEAYLSADYKTAARYLKKAVKKSPEQGEWWLYLGVCYYLRHDAKSALEVLEKADELTDGKSKRRARWFLAQSSLLADEPDRAVKLLEWLIDKGKEFSGDALKLLIRLREDDQLGAAEGSRPTLISPQGGEIFISGTTIEIEWDEPRSDFEGEYEIWLSTDGGITFPTQLTADIPAGQLLWSWEWVDAVGTRLSFRVEAVEGGRRLLGIGGPEFTVTQPPALTVLVPNRRERWHSGFPHQIRWSNPGKPPLRYEIELCESGESEPACYYTLADDIDGGAMAWEWTDVSWTGAGFLIKVIAVYTDSSMEDISDEPFEILPAPEIEVSIPKMAYSGEHVTIDWNHVGEDVRRHSIELLPVGGGRAIKLTDRAAGIARSWKGEITIPAGEYQVVVYAHLSDGAAIGRSLPMLRIIPSRDSRTASSHGEEGTPAEITLDQNYPNPFNSVTNIRFELTEASEAELKVYNIRGQEVKTLVRGRVEVGMHVVEFDAASLASGTYIYRLIAGNQTFQKRMVLMK